MHRFLPYQHQTVHPAAPQAAEPPTPGSAGLGPGDSLTQLLLSALFLPPQSRLLRVTFPCCALRAASLGSIFVAIKQHFHWAKLHFNSKRRGLLKAAAGPVWRQSLLFFFPLPICAPYASTAEKLTSKFFKKERNV